MRANKTGAGEVVEGLGAGRGRGEVAGEPAVALPGDGGGEFVPVGVVALGAAAETPGHRAE